MYKRQVFCRILEVFTCHGLIHFLAKLICPRGALVLRRGRKGGGPAPGVLRPAMDALQKGPQLIGKIQVALGATQAARALKFGIDVYKRQALSGRKRALIYRSDRLTAA